MSILTALESKEAEMRIIGCDLHAAQQTIAMLDHDEPSKVLEPGTQPLNLPPPLVATQRATVLRPLRPSPPVWRNQLHTSAR